MTAPKRWPNRAAWARDDTAALLQRIVRQARDLQIHNDPHVRAGAGLIVDDAQRGIRYLIQVGAEVEEDGLR